VLETREKVLADFMLRSQAPGAQVEPFFLSVYGDRDGMDIGYPAPVGTALGVADIMAELR
jgi:hypothetical protein